MSMFIPMATIHCLKQPQQSDLRKLQGRTIGDSPAMRAIFDKVARTAPSRVAC